ncbi:hypothetical protein [Scytonema sp. NUACC26]
MSSRPQTNRSHLSDRQAQLLLIAFMLRLLQRIDVRLPSSLMTHSGRCG